jgi:hypothetical protein
MLFAVTLFQHTNEIMTKKRHLQPLKPHSRALYPQKTLAGRHIVKCRDTLAKCRDTMKVLRHFQSFGYVAKFSGESFHQEKMSATYPIFRRYIQQCSKGHQITRLKADSEGQNIRPVSSLQTVARTVNSPVAACEKQS